MNQLDRLQIGVLPGGRTYLRLLDPGSDRGVVLDTLPTVEQHRMLREWALSVAAEASGKRYARPGTGVKDGPGTP